MGVLGGFGAVNGNVTQSGGTTPPGRTFINKTNTLIAGTVWRVRFFFHDVHTGADIKFKVFRQNGSNLDFIGETESFDTTGLGTGVVEFQIVNTIDCEAGDFPAYFITDNGATNELDADNDVPGNIKWKTADVTSNDAESGFNSATGKACLEFYDDNVLITPNPADCVVDTVGPTVLIAGSIVITPAPADCVVDTVGPTVLGDNFLGIGDSICEGHPNYHGPEHTGPSGDTDSQIWPHLVTELGGGLSVYNGGVGGLTAQNILDKTDYIDGDFADMLAAKNPATVYVVVGSNDQGVMGGTSLAAFLIDLGQLKTIIETAGAEAIFYQIIPVSNSGGGWPSVAAKQNNRKIWNAGIEKFCFDNSLKLAPSYQEMAETDVANEDDLESSFDNGDGTHPNVVGYTRLGQLLAHAAVPDRFRYWGHTSYEDFGYESWSWWLLTGSASITGDADTGSLNLPQNDTGSGSVKCIESGSKTITITPSLSQGTVDIKYRTSDTNFDRDDAAGWSDYSAPFITTDQFIQVRLVGSSGADAIVSEVLMTWVLIGGLSIPVAMHHYKQIRE